MIDAIVTKYHGPTNTKGARISARIVGARTLFLPYPYELSGPDCHAAAAAALLAKLNLPAGKLIAAHMPTGGYVFLRGAE